VNHIAEMALNVRIVRCRLDDFCFVPWFLVAPPESAYREEDDKSTLSWIRVAFLMGTPEHDVLERAHL